MVKGRVDNSNIWNGRVDMVKGRVDNSNISSGRVGMLVDSSNTLSYMLIYGWIVE